MDRTLFLVIGSRGGAVVTMSVATARVPSKKQTLDEAYSPPANFLEIDVADPATHGFAKTRYTDYEIRMKTNLPVFKMKVRVERKGN